MIRLIFLLTLLFLQAASAQIPYSPLSEQVEQNVWPKLAGQLKAKGFRQNNPIFLRILKEERVLEVWMLKGDHYAMFKEYPCTYSGGLGTKTREGDGKSPEGFYTITGKQLNPFSTYRLSINIGYPNAMERANNYTGNAIMIHGGCASIGCYAMTDAGIDEIYTMVGQALQRGQKAISLHILPYKMSGNDRPTTNLLIDLKKGYDLFERDRIPPQVSVNGKRYAFSLN